MSCAQILRQFVFHLACQEKFAERAPILWEWWWSRRNKFPKFWRLVERAVLIQHSLASMERAFLKLKGHTGKNRAGEDPDTLELRALCLITAKILH